MATFGKTSIGATSDIISSAEYIQCKFTLSQAGTVNGIYVRTGLPYHPGETKNVSYSIFSDSSGDPGSEIISPSGTINDTVAWYSITGLSQSLAAGDYWLGFWCEVHMYCYRDAGSSGQSRRKFAGVTFDTWESPWTNTNIDSAAYEWSIYVDYTPSASAVKQLALLGVG